MIVPIRTSTIARTAPTARVRRKRDTITGEVSASDLGADPADNPPVAAASEPKGRRQGGSKPSPAFLASLLVLRRGG